MNMTVKNTNGEDRTGRYVEYLNHVKNINMAIYPGDPVIAANDRVAKVDHIVINPGLNSATIIVKEQTYEKA